MIARRGFSAAVSKVCTLKRELNKIIALGRKNEITEKNLPYALTSTSDQLAHNILWLSSIIEE